MDDEQLNGLATEGKGGENEKAGRGKVEDEDRAEETISWILKAYGVVLKGKTNELGREGIEKTHPRFFLSSSINVI